MSLIVKPKSNIKKMGYSQQGLYSQILITKNISISINNIGNSIKETLEKAIANQIEGKCIVEGYIKPNTIEIITFSSGLIMGSNVIFEVVFQCYVCSPVEGMNISCIAKHINKAGIRAEVNETPSPVVIFVARDHNYASPLFSQIKENDEIKVRVIGQRFELNDKYISIIAELIDSQHPKARGAKKISKPLELKAVAEPDISEEEPDIVEEPVQEPMQEPMPVQVPQEEEETLPVPVPVPVPATAAVKAPTIVPSKVLTPAITKKATTLKIKKPKLQIQN